MHNVSNSLAALACSFGLGLDIRTSVKALEAYSGVGRRFDLKGSFEGISVVDDYAHHPTEVQATLKAAANMGYDRIWCVFQPHTYTRTKAFLQEFASSFGNVHKVLLADIYAAREADDGSISAKQLADAINGRSANAMYLGRFEAIEKHLLENAKSGDLIITMGAGDVYKIAGELLK